MPENTKTKESTVKPFLYGGLKRVTEFFEKNLTLEQKEGLSKVHIMACQHILEPQLVMYQQMMQLGFRPEHIHVLGKIYSTSFDVVDEMMAAGIDVVQPLFDFSKSFDEQHRTHAHKLLENKGVDYDTFVILDDGAEVLKVSADIGRYPIAGVEQTSSGFRKLEHMDLKFPVLNVARSMIKLQKETPFVIRVAIENLRESLIKWNLKQPKFLVLGQGPIGIEMSKVLGQEFETSSYDRNQGKYDPVQLILSTGCDIVIGSTGYQVLTHEQLVDLNKKTNKKLYFVSMSSSDREFELWKMRDLFKEQATHDDMTFENITVANNGFPITFKGKRNGATPAEMERTMSLLFGSTIHAATHKIDEKGFVDVPKYLTDLID